MGNLVNYTDGAVVGRFIAKPAQKPEKAENCTRLRPQH